MSKDEDIVRLRHMLDAAVMAVDFTKTSERADLNKDEKLTLAIVRLLEVLGEAAKNVSDKFRMDYPAIPWREIAGTRDRLIHGYFDIDLDIVWAIVSVDLPKLITELEKIIESK